MKTEIHSYLGCFSKIGRRYSYSASLTLPITFPSLSIFLGDKENPDMWLELVGQSMSCGYKFCVSDKADHDLFNTAIFEKNGVV